MAFVLCRWLNCGVCISDLRLHDRVGRLIVEIDFKFEVNLLTKGTDGVHPLSNMVQICYGFITRARPFTFSSRIVRWARLGHREPDISGWLQYIACTCSGKKRLSFHSRLLAINALIYLVWRARNKAIYTGEFKSIEFAVIIIKECKERIRIKGKFTCEVNRDWGELLGL